MTMFEQAVRSAVQASGITYSQLAKEANVDPSQVGKFMAGKRGLTTESVGRILDALGCTLTAPINRYAPKPVGRPRIIVDHKLPKSVVDQDPNSDFSPPGSTSEIV